MLEIDLAPICPNCGTILLEVDNNSSSAATPIKRVCPKCGHIEYKTNINNIKDSNGETPPPRGLRCKAIEDPCKTIIDPLISYAYISSICIGDMFYNLDEPIKIDLSSSWDEQVLKTLVQRNSSVYKKLP